MSSTFEATIGDIKVDVEFEFYPGQEETAFEEGISESLDITQVTLDGNDWFPHLHPECVEMLEVAAWDHIAKERALSAT
jgi:hypothetical protein